MKKNVLLLAFGACFLLSGCVSLAVSAAKMAVEAGIEASLSGDTIRPLGNGKYQVSYDGSGAHQYWLEACSKACNKGSFEIESQQQVLRPKGISGWTGIIKCSGSKTAETAAFVSGIDTEKTVRARLDKGGAPINEWVYNDHKPITKIMFYKRGESRHPVLFTYDEQSKEFMYQDMKKMDPEKYEDALAGRNPKFKEFCESWYVRILVDKISKYGKDKKYDLQFELIKKLQTVYPMTALGYNDLAWFYATCPKNEYRDGKKAVEYAEKAVSISKSWQYLDTLAAAYAEIGNFEKAVQIEQEAISSSPEKDQEMLTKCLEAYKSGKTYAQLNAF